MGLKFVFTGSHLGLVGINGRTGGGSASILGWLRGEPGAAIFELVLGTAHVGKLALAQPREKLQSKTDSSNGCTTITRASYVILQYAALQRKTASNG